jgi:hypothetical protein
MTVGRESMSMELDRHTGREDEVLADEARRILRAEMLRRGYSFKQLAEALEAQKDGGPVESVQTLTNKVNRGRFSFAFFLRVARAMGITSIELKQIHQDSR